MNIFAYVPGLQEIVAQARCSTLRREWTHILLNYSHTYVYKFKTQINTFINPYTYINQYLCTYIPGVSRARRPARSSTLQRAQTPKKWNVLCRLSFPLAWARHTPEFRKRALRMSPQKIPTYISAKEPYVCLRNPAKKPCVSPEKSCLSAEQDHLSAKEPCLPAWAHLGESTVCYWHASEVARVYICLWPVLVLKRRNFNITVCAQTINLTYQLLFLARHHNYSAGAPRIISDSDWKFGFVSRNLRYPQKMYFSSSSFPPTRPSVHNVYVPYSPPELSIESRVFIANWWWVSQMRKLLHSPW